MIRRILTALCLFAGLRAFPAMADEAPVIVELPVTAQDAPATGAPTPEPEQDSATACAEAPITYASGSSGCETIVDPCRRACCYEYFDCRAACGFDLLCIFACDQADAACVQSC